VNAAREPAVRNGAFLSANDSLFWAAVAQFYPTLSAADQQEWGTKQLKREWLEYAWAHIADRTGATRRALAFASSDYWDWGTVDPTVTTLMQTITPTRPFGIGLYYSVSVERAIEIANPGAKIVGTVYMNPNVILAAKQAMPLNYFVSDAALPVLQPSAAPTGWLVLGAGNKLPAAEQAALTKIAPIYTTVAQAQAASPLQFTGGLTGTAFYDQHSRLIVTVTNPSTVATAVAISGVMELSGLANGTYTMTDLFSGTKTSVPVSGGSASIPVTVTRWDTRAFAFTLQ